MTTAVEYLASTSARLSADGFTVTEARIGGLDAVTGHRAEFRWTWMATRLHLLTVVAARPTVTAADLVAFTDAAIDHAVAAKGQWRGLQSGVAVIAALVGDTVDPDAVASARSTLPRKFATVGWPVVVDTGTGQVHSHQGRVAVGGIYVGYLRERTAAVLTAPAPTADARG